MKTYLLIFLSIISISASAQVFWTEDFGTGCNTGNFANGYATANGIWVETDIAPPATYANEWFISAHTRNTGVGICADDCVGGVNRTLHIGNVAIPSLGLAAEAGSYLTGFYCSLGFCSTTHKRIESPLIDCTGKNSITLSCIYYEGGDVQGGTNGDCSVWYYDGATWTMIDPLAKTNNAPCSGTIYGVWANYSISLPASANNNANVKIGFQWDNDDVSAGSDPSAAFDDIQLSAATSAVPVAGFESDVTTGCDSVCVTFTDTSLGATSSSWSFPGGNPSTSTSTTQLVCYSGAGNYDVTLISTNSFGSDTATQGAYINVAETPVPDFSISDQNICVGDCVSFSDLSTGTVQVYSWTFTDGFPLTSNQQNPSFICYLTPGNFSVTLTVENATCTNSITRVSYVNVNQAGIPVVTLASDTLSSTAAITYQWYEVTTGPIAAGIFQNYVATQTGDYYVCIQDAFGCSACSDTTHVDFSSVPELTVATVSIYPNPVENELNVQTNTPVIEISILDVCGKRIITAEPKSNAPIKTIDTTPLATGIYWIEVQSAGKLFRNKFVKISGQ